MERIKKKHSVRERMENCLNGASNVVRKSVWMKEIIGDKLGKNASKIIVW